MTKLRREWSPDFRRPIASRRVVARGYPQRHEPGTRRPSCAIIRRAAVLPAILQVFMIDLMESYRGVARTARTA
ncbi:hypothetical protein CJU94_13140 [Paraburkholderia aromaticivorans]|uniref:Uncharacterized protein n=1 Tax=Paraburkholderia aromaticivorans TaxID=2026199 RepID=A0A248VIZ9_9BURK|nr:hypothetical protein CJU94_13140 [Paraburkholderia aromaticivorans]